MTMRIDIRADAGQAKREIKAVAGDLRGLGASTVAAGSKMGAGFGVAGAAAASMGVAVVGAAATAGAELVRMSANVAGLGDETAKMARNLAIGADSLQALQFAAERSGVGQKTLTNGFKLLSRNMLEAQQGSERIASTFDALGVAVTSADGTLRPVEDVFRDLTAVLGAMGETTEATAVRTQLLGRSGNEMANLMSGGVAGLEELERTLVGLNGVMSGELLDSSEAFEDATTNMDTAVKGLKNALAVELLPEMTTAVELATDFAVGLGHAGDVIDVDFLPAIAATVGAFASLNPLTKALVDGLTAIAIKGAQARNASEGVFELPPVEDMIAALKADEARLNLAQQKAREEQAAAAKRARADAQRRAREQESARIAQVRAVAEAELTELQIRGQQEIRQATEDTDRFRINQGMRLSATLLQIERDLQTGVLTEQQAALNRRLEFERVATEAFAFEAEQRAAIEAEQARLAQERRDAAVQADRDRAAGQQAIGMASIDLAQGVGEAIIAIDGAVAKNQAKAAKRAFAIRKASAIASAIVNTAQGVTNALGQITPPANFVVAGLVGALGAAQVAAIAAQPPPAGIADAGLSPEMAQRMASTHTTMIVRRDEAIIDPRGTSEISQMLAIQRRRMEMDDGGGGTTLVSVATTPETLRESSRVDQMNEGRLSRPVSATLGV